MDTHRKRLHSRRSLLKQELQSAIRFHLPLPSSRIEIIFYCELCKIVRGARSKIGATL